MAEFLIITGMSGAGRSQASDTFEDMGWFVIDNMPTALISKVMELVAAPGSETERVALVVGRAGNAMDELTAAIEQLQLARSAGDGDFYQLSVVDARLKDLRAQYSLEMRDAKR